MVFVIFLECGPGTSVTGYVCPTTKIFLTSRRKYLVSPLTVLLQNNGMSANKSVFEDSIEPDN